MDFIYSYKSSLNNKGRTCSCYVPVVLDTNSINFEGLSTSEKFSFSSDVIVVNTHLTFVRIFRDIPILLLYFIQYWLLLKCEYIKDIVKYLLVRKL